MEDTVVDDIFSVLVKELGANPSDLDQFRQFMNSDGREFRFQGCLGFGGKFWRNRLGAWYVNCHLEDLTEDKVKKIDLANKTLKGLYQKSFPKK